jgi:hypothetical protein
MRRMLYTLVFLALALPASADTLTLASKYSVSGSNPDGSKYSGTANVKVISESTFTIKWSIAGATYEGFGMRMNDTLSATYTIDGEPGLIIYKVDGNGLNGIWAVRGHDKVGTEQLQPQN